MWQTSKYKLPKTVYKKTIWTIKDYERMKQRREEILQACPAPPDGQPRGGNAGDEVLRKAVQLAEVDAQICAIDKALEKVPPEYRKGVWDFIQTRKPFPVDAAVNTYKMWKQRFVYWTAVNLQWR